MTGFGQAEGMVGSARVSVEIRTVNHRFFSPSIKLPGPFARWEADVREAMRLRVSRGHVTLTARAEPSARIEYLFAYGAGDYRLDPRNPRKVRRATGDASEVVGSGYESPPEFAEPPTERAPRVQTMRTVKEPSLP